MGLLDRFKQDRKPLQAPVVRGDGTYRLECVGESNYVDALYALGRQYDSQPNPDDEINAAPVPVAIVVEPDNPHDPNAIRICDMQQGHTLAYLSRADAVRYHQALVTLGGAASCEARIGGGLHGDDTGGVRWLIGIWLDVPEPDAWH